MNRLFGLQHRGVGSGDHFEMKNLPFGQFCYDSTNEMQPFLTAFSLYWGLILYSCQYLRCWTGTDWLCQETLQNNLQKSSVIQNNSVTLDKIANLFVNKIWETLHNPNFNPLKFEGFRKEAGLNAFTLSPTRWIEATHYNWWFVRVAVCRFVPCWNRIADTHAPYWGNAWNLGTTYKHCLKCASSCSPLAGAARWYGWVPLPRSPSSLPSSMRLRTCTTVHKPSSHSTSLSVVVRSNLLAFKFKKL